MELVILGKSITREDAAMLLKLCDRQLSKLIVELMPTVRSRRELQPK